MAGLTSVSTPAASQATTPASMFSSTASSNWRWRSSSSRAARPNRASAKAQDTASRASRSAPKYPDGLFATAIAPTMHSPCLSGAARKDVIGACPSGMPTQSGWLRGSPVSTVAPSTSTLRHRPRMARFSSTALGSRPFTRHSHSAVSLIASTRYRPDSSNRPT